MNEAVLFVEGIYVFCFVLDVLIDGCHKLLAFCYENMTIDS